jgi:hypothetical protein
MDGEIKNQKPLLHDTWLNLLRLTGEHITPDKLQSILSDILQVKRLDELTESQAAIVIEALMPLTRLRGLLWDGCIDAIENEQAKPGRKLSKVDPIVAADIIVPNQVDRLAALLIKQQVQSRMFDKSQPPV